MKKNILIVCLAVIFATGIVAANATLYDYFVETEGSFPTVSQRATMANQGGITNYTGTAAQNIALEAYLRDSSPTFGSSLPIAGSTYNLAGSGISSSATSITLQSLTITQTGQKIADSNLDDIFYITVEPGNKKRQEISSCTTVTQNSGGTATLSGCVRGLAPITPYTASTTLQFSHAGASQVIFSNPPQLYNKYAAKTNDEVIQNKWVFDIHPQATSTLGMPTTTYQYITKQYADSIVNQGAATSTTDVGGISILSTPAQNASSTQWGVSDPHVQQSEHSTSTPSTAIATLNAGIWDVWSENDGKLNQRWFDLTEAFSFSDFTSASSTLNGNTLLGNATTTGSMDVGNLCFGGVDCHTNIGNRSLYASSTSNGIINSNSSTTIATFTIPGNYVTGTNMLVGSIPFIANAGTSIDIQFAVKIDSTYILYAQPTYVTATGTIDIMIGGKDQGANQSNTIILTAADTGASTEKARGKYVTSDSTIDFTTAKTFTVEGKWSSSLGEFKWNNVNFDIKR